MTRHPCREGGKKTRTMRDGQIGWRMYCDEDGCTNASDIRRSQARLPLEEFQKAGWFIAATWGDICPRCLAKGVLPPADRAEFKPQPSERAS